MAGLPGLPALDRKPCCQNPVLRPVARLGLRNGGEGTVNGTAPGPTSGAGAFTYCGWGRGGNLVLLLSSGFHPQAPFLTIKSHLSLDGCVGN